jgi:CRISPR-associated protein Cas1
MAESHDENYCELPQKTLPLFKDKWTPIYLEHGKVHVDGSGVRWIDSSGNKIILPVASTSCILLGPGTSISHEAIRTCANSNTLVMWVGREGFKFYAIGVINREQNKYIENQAKYFSSPQKRKLICQKLFEYRFREKIGDKSIDQIRGEEGIRVKNIYMEYHLLYGTPWYGRRYDPDDIFSSDNINYSLNISNYSLYSYCLSCILYMGFSPSLGFLHSGHNLSFVFDIADLFKNDTSIKSSFYTVSKDNIRPSVDLLLSNLKMFIEKEKVNDKMSNFLSTLFDEK